MVQIDAKSGLIRQYSFVLTNENLNLYTTNNAKKYVFNCGIATFLHHWVKIRHILFWKIMWQASCLTFLEVEQFT